MDVQLYALRGYRKGDATPWTMDHGARHTLHEHTNPHDKHNTGLSAHHSPQSTPSPPCRHDDTTLELQQPTI